MYVYWLGSDRLSGHLFLCAFTFFLTHASLLIFASVSLFYLILTVPMHECLLKHSCPIVWENSYEQVCAQHFGKPNGTCFFLTAQLHMRKRYLKWDSLVGWWLSNFLLLLLLLLFPRTCVGGCTRAWVIHFLFPFWLVLFFFARWIWPCCGQSFPYQKWNYQI